MTAAVVSTPCLTFGSPPSVFLLQTAKLTIGNVLPVSQMPEGTVVCNLEEKPGDRSAIGRASGNYCTIIAHNTDTGEEGPSANRGGQGQPATCCYSCLSSFFPSFACSLSSFRFSFSLGLPSPAQHCTVATNLGKSPCVLSNPNLPLSLSLFGFSLSLPPSLPGFLWLFNLFALSLFLVFIFIVSFFTLTCLTAFFFCSRCSNVCLFFTYCSLQASLASACPLARRRRLRRRAVPWLVSLLAVAVSTSRC